MSGSLTETVNTNPASTQTVAGAAAPQKVPAHIDLRNAVLDLNGIIRHLMDLRDEIQGVPAALPKDVEASKDPTNLHEVLANSAGHIRAVTSEAHALIGEIHKLLYL